MSVLHARITGPGDAAAVFHHLVSECGEQVEGLLVLGLDADRRATGVAVNPRHRALSWMKVWELADLAQELEACALVAGVLAGPLACIPSEHEVTTFVDLVQRSARAGVLLVDCLVLRGQQWWSLAEKSGISENSPLRGLVADG